MGKGLQVLVWSALAGLAAFLAMLVKQKMAALELAQARAGAPGTAHGPIDKCPHRNRVMNARVARPACR
jgi:hypothetical protein